MSFDQTFLAPDADAYLQATLAAPGPVFTRIEDEARAEGQPAVGRATGGTLRALVAANGAKRVLEVGCNLGYSALWMATAMPRDGTLETIEIDPELAARATAHFAEAGVADRTRVLVGAALDLLPTLPDAQYDFIFLDAVKSEYPAYLDHALRLLRPGGTVAADNLFWLGRAWDKADTADDTMGVRTYTRRIFDDPRLTSTIIPVEDGLGVSVLAPGKA